VNEKRGNTGDFSCLQRARERVTQQRSSEPGLMVIFVNRQTTQHHYRDGVRPVASQRAGSFGMRERTRRKAAVADNSFAHADDVSAGRTTGLIARGTSLQPIVGRRLPAIERINDMVVRKRLRR